MKNTAQCRDISIYCTWKATQVHIRKTHLKEGERLTASNIWAQLEKRHVSPVSDRLAGIICWDPLLVDLPRLPDVKIKGIGLETSGWLWIVDKYIFSTDSSKDTKPFSLTRMRCLQATVLPSWRPLLYLFLLRLDCWNGEKKAPESIGEYYPYSGVPWKKQTLCHGSHLGP